MIKKFLAAFRRRGILPKSSLYLSAGIANQKTPAFAVGVFLFLV